jgi:hypothetical protein
MLPLGMLLLLRPRLSLLRLRQCWYPTRQRYLYETSESERGCIDGLGCS